MQRYMPSIHQKFLHELSNSPRSVRDLAERTPSLVAPYDSCVMALKRFRDAHMRVACLYVVSMSRAVPKAGCPVSAMWEQMQAEGAVCPVSQKKAPVRGTGGNELSVLLKSCRDATTRTLIGDSA
jgi:indoleamine 2,3-dioxygenase